MKYHFDVSKLVTSLKKYSNELEKLYNWKSNSDELINLGLITSEKLDELNSNNSVFSKEIYIKKVVKDALHLFYKEDKKQFKKLSMWVIVQWGGIRAANEAVTLPLIYEFIENDKKPFDRIASYSKVASFMYPKECIIYDARVAYSLNWLLLSQKAGKVFFPIPKGRNSKMNAFDMDVLIRISNIEQYSIDSITDIDKKFISNRDKSLYIPKEDAYYQMNKLVKAINDQLWNGNKDELYYTEMLLFSIADTYITQDIINKVSIEINL